MDRHCVKLLMGLFLLDEGVWLQSMNADLIMVAPSSLWSRLRGRVDLAYLLAAKLSSLTSKPLVYSPPSCYWRFRKRARVKHRQGRNKSAFDRFFETLSLKARLALIRWLPLPILNDFGNYVDVVWFRKHQMHQYKNLLLIDDVVTTGETIRTAIMKMQLARKKFYMANHMPEEEIQIRCLTLAHGNM